MKTYTMILSLALLTGWTPRLPADEAQPVAPGPTDKALIQLTGKFHVIWGDPVGESNVPPHHSFRLTEGGGKISELVFADGVLGAAGGMLTLNGAEVMVEGRSVSARRPTLDAHTITRLDDGTSDSMLPGIFGSQPYVWLLFRFADNPSYPETPDWFEEQALGEYGMDPFWREVSYNNVNLIGSEVIGWFDLSTVPADYGVTGDPDNGDVNLDALLADALQVSDPHVDFSIYAGMNLIFNSSLDCCAWGGRPVLDLDGQHREWGVTWLGNGGFQGHEVTAHEMGHSFGLPHSAGCGVKYGSDWDLLSEACGACTHLDPRTGTPHGIHPNAYHKNRLGWIHSLHRYYMSTAAPAVGAVWLNDLAVVPPQGRLLMAHVFWPTNPAKFYTIERRRWTGFDRNLPSETVVIHSVDETLEIPADLIDSDGGECNDDGSMWEPGESFSDRNNGIVVTVEWADQSGSIVTLTNAARDFVYVDGGYGGYQDGSSVYPWDTVWEGHGAAYPHANVYVRPSSYPELLTLRKPAVVRRWGASGVVRIGQ